MAKAHLELSQPHKRLLPPVIQPLPRKARGIQSLAPVLPERARLPKQALIVHLGGQRHISRPRHPGMTVTLPVSRQAGQHLFHVAILLLHVRLVDVEFKAKLVEASPVVGAQGPEAMKLALSRHPTSQRPVLEVEPEKKMEMRRRFECAVTEFIEEKQLKDASGRSPSFSDFRFFAREIYASWR